MTVHEPPACIDPLARYDAQNRKIPKKLGFIELLRGRNMAQWLKPFDKAVPAAYWRVDTNAEGGAVTDTDGNQVVVVSCPCKADPEPRVPFNTPTPCEGEGCGRWFFYDGSRVRVARDEDNAPTPVVN